MGHVRATDVHIIPITQCTGANSSCMVSGRFGVRRARGKAKNGGPLMMMSPTMIRPFDQA